MTKCLTAACIGYGGIWDKKGDIWVKICKIYEKALDF